MNYIAIDTSGSHLTVAARKGDKLAINYNVDCKLKHSVTLLPALESVLEKLGMQIEEANFIAAVVGPGSFTGIRIGVATVMGLCAKHNIKALAVTEFEVLAYAKEGGKLLTLIDAKHDHFYSACYDNKQLIGEPSYASTAELIEKSTYSAISSQYCSNFNTEIVDASIGLVNACDALYSKATSAEELKPYYLRLSQAEEGRP